MSDAAPIEHVSFYKFVHLAEPERCAQRLRELAGEVQGVILVAHEGINGAIAASPVAITNFAERISRDPVFQGAFTHLTFKRSQCRTQPFHRMKVHVRPEVLPLGVDDAAIDMAHAQPRMQRLSPAQWRELLKEEDVVVIDNRNSFEYRLGHFAGAVDPGVDNYRDFPRFIENKLPQWQREGKRIAMYCTGGIRCEKTAAWMLTKDVPVYQLEGGILNYFASLPDADRDWQGECFVFDNRIAIDTQLRETDTTAEQVYDDTPDEAWRLRRARKLAEGG